MCPLKWGRFSRLRGAIGFGEQPAVQVVALTGAVGKGQGVAAGIFAERQRIVAVAGTGCGATTEGRSLAVAIPSLNE